MARPARLVVLEQGVRLELERLQRSLSAPAGLSPGARAVLLMLPLREGRPARRTRDYRRNGLTSLYAALEVVTGRALGECADRHCGAPFLRFLRQVFSRYRSRDLHLILDNSSTHATPAVQAWLPAHPRVRFHFTPNGAIWLHMLEAWFSILARKSVRRGSFDPVRALIRRFQKFIEQWNENTHPFVWTKDPVEIIHKAVRLSR